MLSGLGHTDEEPNNSVPGPATSMEDVGYRLATSCGEGRKTFGGTANKGDVEGRWLLLLPSFLSTIPLFHLSIFKVLVGIGKTWKVRRF